MYQQFEEDYVFPNNQLTVMNDKDQRTGYNPYNMITNIIPEMIVKMAQNTRTSVEMVLAEPQFA